MQAHSTNAAYTGLNILGAVAVCLVHPQQHIQLAAFRALHFQHLSVHPHPPPAAEQHSQAAHLLAGAEVGRPCRVWGSGSSGVVSRRLRSSMPGQPTCWPGQRPGAPAGSGGVGAVAAMATRHNGWAAGARRWQPASFGVDLAAPMRPAAIALAPQHTRKCAHWGGLSQTHSLCLCSPAPSGRAPVMRTREGSAWADTKPGWPTSAEAHSRPAASGAPRNSRGSVRSRSAWGGVTRGCSMRRPAGGGRRGVGAWRWW